MQSTRTKEEVSEYIEWQSQYKCKVLSAKPEHCFEDLRVPVHVWNVKTDTDGAWWVVEGQTVPMNLYPQEAYYFSADEVYSFHMGLMQRMESRGKEYIPGDYVEAVAQNSNIAPLLFRKLKSIAMLIDTAVEIEDFQAIGVQCREILIQLGNYVYEPHMAGEEDQPQASNFKRKGELCIQFYCPGQPNKDYRGIIKKLTEAVWDLSCKITHSTSSTTYDVSSCVLLCISLVSTYINVIQKSEDFISTKACSSCSSKKLKIIDIQHTEEQIIESIQLECEECGAVNTISME